MSKRPSRRVPEPSFRALTYSFEGEATVEDAESHAKKLEHGEWRKDLLLYTNLEGRRAVFGGETALMQLLITWAQRKVTGKDKKLRVHANRDQQAPLVIQSFANSRLGRLAAAMDMRVTDHSGRRRLDAEVRALVNEYFESIDHASPKGMTRGAIFLLAPNQGKFRHPGWLYVEKPPPDLDPGAADLGDFLRDKQTAMPPLASQIIETVFRRTPRTQHLQSILDLQTLGGVLFELLENTQRWAQQDAVGEWIVPSTACVFVRMWSLEELAARRLAQRVPPVVHFIDQTAWPDHQEMQSFIEISILDGGPGIASRRLVDVGHDPRAADLAEEVKALRWCLAKGKGSEAGRTHVEGLGLHKVLRKLTDLHGFVRIRSGRLSLYRDLVEHPYHDETGEFPRMWDWKSLGLTPTQFPQLNGALVTMLIPAQK